MQVGHLSWKTLCRILVSGLLVFAVISQDPVAVEQTGEGVEFIPSIEWQDVLPGQHLPPGLHIQINMQTGKKRAKLNDESEQPNHHESALIVSKDASVIVDTSGNSQVGILLDAPVSNDDASIQEPAPQRPKPKPWTEEERQEKLKMIRELNNLMAADRINHISIFQECLASLSNSSIPISDKFHCLENMEDLCHQIDFANDLVIVGGLPVLFDLIGSDQATDERLKLAQFASWVVGTAAQNNREFQEKLSFSRGIHHLVNGLKTVMRQQDLAGFNEHHFKLAAKLVYALSTSLRGFEQAQDMFFDAGGPEVLLKTLLLNSPPKTTTTMASNIRELKLRKKLRDKAISLVDDLVNDRIFNGIYSFALGASLEEKQANVSTDDEAPEDGPKIRFESGETLRETAKSNAVVERGNASRTKTKYVDQLEIEESDEDIVIHSEETLVIGSDSTVEWKTKESKLTLVSESWCSSLCILFESLVSGALDSASTTKADLETALKVANALQALQNADKCQSTLTSALSSEGTVRRAFESAASAASTFSNESYESELVTGLLQILPKLLAGSSKSSNNSLDSTTSH